MSGREAALKEHWPVGRIMHPQLVVKQKAWSWKIENRFEYLLYKERDDIAEQCAKKIPPVAESGKYH